jgi:geranyllinalool synthase
MLSYIYIYIYSTKYASFACADSFCWFLQHEDIRDQIEKNQEYFSSAMFNVYRATDLMFSGEYDLQEARSFSKKLLTKTVSLGTRDHTHFISSNLRGVVIHSFINTLF